MVENIKLSYNEDKTALNMEVTLSLIEKEKEHFLAEDAIKYLNDNKIYFVKLLSGAIVSNVSDRRRVGTFSFLVNNAKERPVRVKKEKKAE